MGEALLLRSRKFPFKTKLKASYEINWGMETKEAEYPTRKERSVQLFDLKSFVSEEKRKKMMENSDGRENAFAPSPFGGLSGPNPFAGSMPNPFAGSMPNPFSPSGNKEFDIDKVMADIDKRLKELDEEEAKEKQALEAKKKAEQKEQLSVKPEPKIEQPKEKPIVEQKENKPKINVDNDSVVVNDNVVTDDEFFDDFFGD